MVAMTVWPTDAADGSVATEARWRKMGRQWLASGVVDNLSGEMAPSLAYPNLTVQAGACWVDGHYAELAGSQVLAVTANGLAVVRFDPAANTAELLYRDGVSTPAQNPNGTWELPIAKLTGSALTDQRAFVKPTGLVGDGPQGLLAMVERTTNAGPQPPSTAVAIGVSISVTVPSRRYVKLTAYIRHVIAGVSGDYGTISIRNPGGSTYADGVYVVVGPAFVSNPVHITRIIPMNAGTETFGIWLQPVVGTVTLYGTVTSPILLAAEDLGPAA